MYDPQLQQAAGNPLMMSFNWLRGGAPDPSQNPFQPPVFPMPRSSSPPQTPTFVNSQAEFDALPEGTLYMGPDGTPGWKTGPVMGLP